ncbi:hypothetical protein QR98_0011190 [Sarcoptes scabiei]|uniref:Uncharacterized protein n=1 Tax=Sarcoptes scabiei TaxID=52283 RepID=A0A131ZVN9_SARSC|nr:hypothetical protein QR98_0011190 [Sarcoptes scabiei]
MWQFRSRGIRAGYCVDKVCDPSPNCPNRNLFNRLTDDCGKNSIPNRRDGFGGKISVRFANIFAVVVRKNHIFAELE